MKVNMLKSLTINLNYLDNSGVVWSFEKLINGKGYIEPEHLDDNEFFHCLGGLDLVTERFFRFYQSTDYYDLSAATNFLLYSIASVIDFKGKVFDKIKIYGEGEIISKLQHTNGDILILKRTENKNQISISYLNSEGEVYNKRNSFYFSNILIDKKIWVQESLVALNEYFLLVERILTKFKNEHSNGSLEKYFHLWLELKSELKP